MREREDTSQPRENSKTGRVVAGGILPWLFLTRRGGHPAVSSCRERHAHTAVVGLFTPEIPKKVLGLHPQPRSNYLKKTSPLPVWVCLASHIMAFPLVGIWELPFYK